ncbi:MAG TPA: GNAT family N-acetyltransferase [Opitutaceae bacterium]
MPPVATPAPLHIRAATEADVPQLLAFIRQLAAYEKLAHEVVATEESLHAALFRGRKVAEALIGESAGQPVAFALFFHNFSTFLAQPGLYLEDLFVLPEHRGQGHGQAMLTHLAKIAHARGCGRFEWSVLDWNEDAIGFYRKLGAVPMNDWTVFRLTGEALTRLATSD